MGLQRKLLRLKQSQTAHLVGRDRIVHSRGEESRNEVRWRLLVHGTTPGKLGGGGTLASQAPQRAAHPPCV